MQNTEKLSLKAFWEAVEQQLTASSADELRAVLRAMAQETPPSARQGFLAKLAPPQAATDTAPRIPQEELLAEITDLAQEIEAEMEGAEEWEERNTWGEEHYDDEDSLGQYEEFIAPLAALFDQTQAAFDYGDFPLACAAYQQLFALLQTEDEYGRGVHLTDLSGVNAEETIARYLRALYEITAPAERPATLYAQIPSMRTLLRRRLMLDDLIQISPRPLPDQETFLGELSMQQALHRVQTYHPSMPQPNFSVWNWGDTLETPASPSTTFLAHTCMLAGEWDAAQQLAAQANVLGWTSATSHQALVVAVFLARLAGETPAALTLNLAQTWKSGVHRSVGFLTDSALALRFDRAYTAQFAQTQWPDDVQARYLAWCLEVARQRVAAIVGGQHRKSYDKAAMLTAACAETLRQRGDQAAATAFVSEIRTRFPRHSAFQAELKRALH